MPKYAYTYAQKLSTSKVDSSWVLVKGTCYSGMIARYNSDTHYHQSAITIRKKLFKGKGDAGPRASILKVLLSLHLPNSTHQRNKFQQQKF